MDKFFNRQFPYEGFQIDTNHIKVTSQVKPAIEEYWGKATAKTFLDQKNIVPLNEFGSIWWSGVSKVMASYPKIFQIFITKNRSLDGAGQTVKDPFGTPVL
jgi:hypothetical protein